MASEECTSRLGDSLSTPAARAKVRAVTLGLIPAPDIPDKIAKELASELPELLRRRVDGSETPFR